MTPDIANSQRAYLYFSRNSVGMQGKDPVKVIKQATAETLVYKLREHLFKQAAVDRLREGPNDKLMVEMLNALAGVAGSNPSIILNDYIVANNLTGLAGNGPFREVLISLDGKAVGDVYPFIADLYRRG
ncbi:hypothetical protein IFM89_029258 [Coptis chinensis]|uniref:Uncharacterized protein n=1 Tax=Coptis chinensis TaxID=261450 RepID=A0A835GYL5_9MAGN|nr:hypothetical protein IFM89_029258 [Coptis chinensis]